MARLTLSFLGTFAATLDGEVITGFESNKVRALLAYLAAENSRSHSREALAALFWPDWPQQSAMSNLRYVLSDLRKNIGDRDADPPFLVITRDHIQFNLDSECWLDLAEFERQVSSNHLQVAIPLYRGPFLDGFVVGDSAPFEEWLALKREQISRQALGILHDLADAHEGRGEYDLALPYAWKQVAIEPWLEEAHQQLMRLLALSGQRSAALAQFETCRKALVKELGVEPSAETVALYEQIRSGKLLEGLPLRRGKTIASTFQNRYQLGPELGRGGMGVVYRAHDTLLDRDVAIKVLSVEALGEEGRLRLLREAQMIAHFNHPHIVSVHDIGEVNGAPCVVMELIEGGTLSDHRPADLASVIAIARQVCAALEHAHAQGIIHRDLKPDNVMLTADGSAKLMDFGLARSTTGPQLTQEGVIIGTLRYLAPELILGENATPRSDLYSLGAMLYEITAGHPLFNGETIIELISQHLHAPVVPPSTYNPEIPNELDTLLVRMLSKHPADRPASAAEVGGLLEGLQSAEAPAPGESPFKGLQFFDESDVGLFFGREALTERLVAHVNEMTGLAVGADLALAHEISPTAPNPPLLAVVGASGSGKSSVVRAGLLAHTRQAHPEWPVYVLTPTTHPLEALAAGLTSHLESVSAAATLMDDLARDPRSLVLFIRRAIHLPEGAHLLLVVDQFEELFTLCHQEAERVAFLDNLLTAVETPSPFSGRSGVGSVAVVLALRADFYAHCAQYPRLRQALCARQEYIGPMSAVEIRRAIEQPAARAGWEFDPGLVDLILRDTGASEDHPPEPGALPLLSHALLETWQRRSGRRLTLRGYHEAGGVHGAIAKTAENVFADLALEQQRLARRIFLRLTELGEGTQDTRRRAPLHELSPHPEDTPQVKNLLKLLADARLITLAEETAEVAHEALIREWPALREWLSEDRDGLRLHRHLTEVAEAWEALGRDAGELYRGARLAQAAEWAAQPGNAEELNELEREFLQASQAQAEQEVQERDAQRQRDLEAAHKLAETERQRAEESRARELGMAAYASLSQDPERSMLLGLEAAKTWQALGRPLPGDLQNTLRQSLQVSRVLQAWHSGDKKIGYVGFRPGDGHPMVVAEADEPGQVTLWDIEDNRALASFPGWIHYYTKIAFSPDGQILAIPGEGENLHLWRIQDGGLWLTLSDHGGLVTGATFSPDGKRLVSFSDMGQKAILWDLPSPRDAGRVGIKRCEYPAPSLGSYAKFSPDGKRLALLTTDNAVRLVDLGGENTPHGTKGESPAGQELAVFRADGRLQVIAFSPDGKLLASSGLTGWVYAWDIETGRKVFSGRVHNADDIVALSFSPDGSCLTEGMLVWEILTGWEKYALLGANQRVSMLAFDAAGARLITASSQGLVNVWCMTASRDVLTLEFKITQLHFTDVAFSPDGRWLASSDPVNNIRVWDFPKLLEKGTQRNPGATDAALVKAFASNQAGFITTLAFSPDGKWLATGSTDRTMKVWETTSWQNTFTDADLGSDLPMAMPMISGVTTVAFSPACGAGSTRCLLAYGGMSGRLILRDILSEEVLLTWQEKNAGIKKLAFSPDGKWLAFGTAGHPETGMGQVKVLDLASGQAIKELTGLASWVHSLAFNPDGKRLGFIEYLSGSIWDLETGENRPLAGYLGGTAMAVGPAGDLLVAGRRGGGLGIWDATSGLSISQLVEPDQIHGPEFGMRFSPDGRYLAACNVDATVRIYTVHPDDLLAQVCARLTRTWRLEECQQYLHTDTCPPDPRQPPQQLP